MRVGSEFINFDMLKAKPSKKTHCYVLKIAVLETQIHSETFPYLWCWDCCSWYAFQFTFVNGVFHESTLLT